MSQIWQSEDFSLFSAVKKRSYLPRRDLVEIPNPDEKSLVLDTVAGIRAWQNTQHHENSKYLQFFCSSYTQQVNWFPFELPPCVDTCFLSASSFSWSLIAVLIGLRAGKRVLWGCLGPTGNLVCRVMGEQFSWRDNNTKNTESVRELKARSLSWVKHGYQELSGESKRGVYWPEMVVFKEQTDENWFRPFIYDFDWLEVGGPLKW